MTHYIQPGTTLADIRALKEKQRNAEQETRASEAALREKHRAEAEQDTPARTAADEAALLKKNAKAELDIRARMDALDALKGKHRAEGRALAEKDDDLSAELRENYAERREIRGY